MAYRRFAFYNVFGALLWVGLLVPAGWAFGNIPAVRDNLTLVMLAIVVASVAVPAVEHACRKARSRRLTSADPTMPPISQTDLQP